MAIDFDRTYLRYLRTVRNSTLTRDEIADMCAGYMVSYRSARSLARLTAQRAELERQAGSMQEKYSVKLRTMELARAAKELRQQLAQKGGRARHAKDPKQADKALVEQCWKEWQRKPNNYPSKAEFARDMLMKFGNLESQKKIEDWCRAWEKATVKPEQSVALRALIKKA